MDTDSISDRLLPSPNEGKESAGSVSDEVDLWWGAYAGRTMLPSFILCFLLTVFIAADSWFMGIWQGFHPARYTVQALVGILWLIQGARCVYRAVWTDYRLTTRRIYRGDGIYRRVSRAVDLASVSRVVVESSPLERLVGVGRIHIFLPGIAQPSLGREGGRNPKQIADQIRKQMN